MTMNLIHLIIFLVLVPIFLVSLYIGLKFEWTDEGKDERGQTIINKAYTAALPVFPIGWLLEHIYHNYIHAVPYEFYRTYIWVLVLVTFIVHGLVILHHKRKM